MENQIFSEATLDGSKFQVITFKKLINQNPNGELPLKDKEDIHAWICSIENKTVKMLYIFEHPELSQEIKHLDNFELADFDVLHTDNKKLALSVNENGALLLVDIEKLKEIDIIKGVKCQYTKSVAEVLFDKDYQIIDFGLGFHGKNGELKEFYSIPKLTLIGETTDMDEFRSHIASTQYIFEYWKQISEKNIKIRFDGKRFFITREL